MSGRKPAAVAGHCLWHHSPENKTPSGQSPPSSGRKTVPRPAPATHVTARPMHPRTGYLHYVPSIRVPVTQSTIALGAQTTQQDWAGAPSQSQQTCPHKSHSSSIRHGCPSYQTRYTSQPIFQPAPFFLALNIPGGLGAEPPYTSIHFDNYRNISCMA